MFESVKKYVDEIILGKKGIPYFEIKVNKDNETVYSYSSTEKDELLYMYSCTKLLTVTCVMRLVEEGKISLKDEVSKYIPEFANAFLLDGNGNKVPAKTPINIEHLLTMSAGLTYDLSQAPVLEAAKQSNYKLGTVDMVKNFVKSPLIFEPGTGFCYSLCHDVLGAVVEVVSGKKFSEYLSENVLKPLEMNNTFFGVNKNTTGKNIKEQYTVDVFNGNKIVPIDESCYKVFIFTDNYESGGAGIVSNVEDYMKFASTMSNGGTSKTGYKLLKKETVEEIKKNRFEYLDVKNGFTCIQGEDYGYGLGVRVRTKALKSGIPVGEFGWDGAAGSYVLLDTENNISIVMGMSLRSWPSIFNDHIKIAELVYEELKINEK